MVLSSRELPWTDWYVFAIALCGCILSRHINLCLAGLLPAVFLISWVGIRAPAVLGGARKTDRAAAARQLQDAFVAIAIAVACLATTSALTRNLARNTRLQPHSRIGYTFLWRLHFLNNLSPDSRAALFRQIRARARSTKVRKLVATLEQLYLQGRGLDDGALMQKGIEDFQGSLHWQELDRALNELAFLFLWPPTTELLGAAKTDFLAGWKAPPTEISTFLFHTTAYYFANREAMPDCAGLVTFRATSGPQIISIPTQFRYLRLWENLSYHKLLFIWLIALVARLGAERRAKVSRSATTTLAIVLTVLGVVMFAASCLLVDNQPRFRLPMWQLLFLSLCLIAGVMANLLARVRSVHSDLITGKGESAGQP